MAGKIVKRAIGRLKGKITPAKPAGKGRPWSSQGPKKKGK
jgi:hypothetical protein